MFDVMCKIWDPILGKYGNQEERANVEPLTEQEADAMIADLGSCCDPEYRGQGQAMLSVRKVATFQAATKLYVTMRGVLMQVGHREVSLPLTMLSLRVKRGVALSTCRTSAASWCGLGMSRAKPRAQARWSVRQAHVEEPMNTLDVEKLREELEDLDESDDRSDNDEERLSHLRALFDVLPSLTDYIVREEDWNDYARDEAEEHLRGVPEALQACIDWEQWADALRSDYTEVDIDGETYLFRS